jgi:hypothetical protein
MSRRDGRTVAMPAAIGLVVTLAGAAPALSSINITFPTAVLDPASPTLHTLDGGFGVSHWLREDMPVRYRVNPANPGPPMVVAPGRDPEAEFVRAIRRSFEHWDRSEVKATFLDYRFKGVTTAPVNAFDAHNTVGFGPPDGCGPFVLGFNRSYFFTVEALVPQTDPPRTTIALPNYPFTVDLGDGRVIVNPEPGQLIESDTVICTRPDLVWSTTLGDGIVIPGTTDLEAVATHEAGHFSGLHHSAVLASSLFDSFEPPEGGLDDAWQNSPILDDDNGVSQLYPRSSFLHQGVIRGRAVVGSLFPALPEPVPFIGPPVAAGSPALTVNVIATNERGLVEGSALTNVDGSFEIAGLDRHGSYTLEAMPFHGRYFGIGWLSGFLDPALSPLVHFRAERTSGVRPNGSPVDIVVHDALPGQGDSLGIGGLTPPTADFVFPGVVQDDPSTPLAEVNFEFGPVVVERGQRLGAGPTNIPGLLDGALILVKVFAGTQAAVDSVDPIEGLRILAPAVPLTFVGAGGQILGSGVGLTAEVEPHAKLGLRNVAITDSEGNRFVLPGGFEVVKKNLHHKAATAPPAARSARPAVLRRSD